MADANLLRVLRDRNNGVKVLEDVVIFGKVRCAIKHPEILGSLEVGNGVFAIIDAFAFKCQGKDYFSEDGFSDINRIYFTKGSLIIFIESLDWVGKVVKVYSTSYRKGCKIKQQFNSKTSTDGIIAIAFMYDSSNKSFYISPNKLLELGKTDKDVRGTVLEDYMASVVYNKEGIIEYPVTLDSLLEYEALCDYEELSNEEASRMVKSVEFDDSEERVDVTKIDLNLTYHMDCAEKSEFYDSFQEEIDDMSDRSRKFTNKLVKWLVEMYKAESKENFDYTTIGYKGSDNDVPYMGEIHSSIRDSFIKRIASNFSVNIGNSKLRGSYFVNKILETGANGIFLQDQNTDPLDRDTKIALKESIINLLNMVAVDPTVLNGRNSEFRGIPIVRDDIDFCTSVICSVLGIDMEGISNNYYWCNKYFAMDKGLWFYILIRFPYCLSLLSSGLSLVECDSIYMTFTKVYSKGCLHNENMKMRSNILFLENLRDCSDKDSLVTESELKRSSNVYSARVNGYISKNGLPINSDLCECVKLLLGNSVILSEDAIKYYSETEWYSEERLETLLESGIVDTINDDIILATDLKKEFLIYKTLIELGNKTTGLTDEDISDVIEDFEEDRGFKLESLQKDGVRLTKYCAAVLSGCAGSGKTTTSDCMTEALKRIPDFEAKYNIVYCAPTGKACRRLAEVVRGTVRTIHSQFGVGIGGGSFLAPVYSKSRSNNDKATIYLMDEMAMCSMPLLYEICRNLQSEDMIYFLGDIKQLPPIGKGNPFALLMKILPCVELGVSKRAAEGSSVNYNTTLINCLSDGAIKELSYNNSDFFSRECSDASIPMEVVRVWRDFMNGSMNGKTYLEDDIQVISGYQTDKYSFSVPNLNPPIQKLLRSNDRLLFKYADRDFYMNDRVIHLKKNDYSMQRYVETDKDVFTPVATFGMVNGEVGKLVGVVRSDMVRIYGFSADNCKSGVGVYEYVNEDDLNDMLSKRTAKEDDLRDDIRFKNSSNYFVKVEVYDSELKKDVVVLYRGSYYMDGNIMCLEGMDLGNLDLAYALTTHKMQGSQSRVVICPFGTNCNPNFINRNMINTMFTRSQEVVCCVGNVKGYDSPINRGRQCVSTIKCSDVLSILAGEY
jgi:hypothetical protein